MYVLLWQQVSKSLAVITPMGSREGLFFQDFTDQEMRTTILQDRIALIIESTGKALLVEPGHVSFGLIS